MNDFYISNLKKNAKIHFIGIGGISMSGLAHICLKEGFCVTGSDSGSSPILNRLEKAGATIYKGHDAQNCVGADLVVYTAAIKDDNPELVYARENNIQNIERSIFLGGVMRDYSDCVCIAGTHGKTTTTSMMSHVLLAHDCDPTILIGGELDEIGGNYRLGKSGCFLTEACEYHSSFLEFFPKYAVITNVDADHLDYFRDLDHIKETFAQYAALPGKDGFVLVCGDDENAMDCITKTDATVITFGIDAKNDIHPCAVYTKQQQMCFELETEAGPLSVQLQVAGKHNLLNALACFAVGKAMGIAPETVKRGVESFTMVHRRFERKGMLNGALIVDDYAHHPTEIMCTLQAAKSIAEGRVVVAFQPHTYTRTYTLLTEFSKGFYDADEVLVFDIYAAREKDTGLIHARDLVQKLQANGINASYAESFESAANALKSQLKAGDILLTMGAGNIFKVGEMILE
ncbi:MAG: UDP-N-acetylmuramate--L-alanine ligase [Clostridia bacterium]|nr:UDP-N-acetylmuramate--L-alanine ligase [Clostridia bacterium]